jgi:hypothetical protein
MKFEIIKETVAYFKCKKVKCKINKRLARTRLEPETYNSQSTALTNEINFIQLFYDDLYIEIPFLARL